MLAEVLAFNSNLFIQKIVAHSSSNRLVVDLQTNIQEGFIVLRNFTTSLSDNGSALEPCKQPINNRRMTVFVLLPVDVCTLLYGGCRLFWNVHPFGDSQRFFKVVLLFLKLGKEVEKEFMSVLHLGGKYLFSNVLQHNWVIRVFPIFDQSFMAK
jgi:hypothetical protein